MDNGSHDQGHDWIRLRAYEFWEAEGQPEGKHEEHWHRASEEHAARNEGGRKKGKTPVRGEVPGLQPFETMTKQDSTD